MIKEVPLEQHLFSFVQEIQRFHYTISSLDHLWEVLFPTQDTKWHHLRVVKYLESYMVIDISGRAGGLEFILPNTIKPLSGFETPQESIWTELIALSTAWLEQLRKDWIAKSKRMQLEYPLELCQGRGPHAIIRSSFPTHYRLDSALGEEKSQKIIDFIESGYLRRSEHTERSSLTANEYFAYCKIAYIAAQTRDEEVDEKLSGRELYRLFADGRDDGLLSIEGDSSEEFSQWLDQTHPLRNVGGHPWEIKRGGNTTHIKLAVYRPLYSKQEVYKVELRGESLGWMAEILQMFLAIHETGLPISIPNPEAVRRRLLAQDFIGIIPAYASYHRGNQRFREDEDVFEVMHYKDLGRYKRRVTPFVTWEPLPLLQPRESSSSLK